MRNGIFIALQLVFVLTVGCAANPIVGHAEMQAGQYFGDVSVVGDGTKLTVTNGSRVPKLSIAGDNCSVTVEDGASLGRLEIWGNGNTVSLPGDLRLTVSQAGANEIIRRPVSAAGTTDSSPAKEEESAQNPG